MARKDGSVQRSGFTLIELLVVIAIIAVIAGIVYASTGEVREKARQTTCLSNLRQIGLAIQMYRQDWGGKDTPGWPTQMGLPPTLMHLTGSTRSGTGRYLSSRQVLLCPSDPIDREGPSSYLLNRWDPHSRFEGAGDGPPAIPPFPEVIARRGSDFPLVVCGHHHHQRPDRAPSQRKLKLVLCLDGRVEARHSSSLSSWEW